MNNKQIEKITSLLEGENYKSMSPEEYLSHVKKGYKLWVLDSATSGNDDVLVGMTEEEVMGDVCHHFDVKELPETWSVKEIEF